MIDSQKYSNIFLRLGLAAVFLWFGIDKFTHPSYWQTAWPLTNFSALIDNFGHAKFMYAAGVFEILTGLSLVSSVLIKFFSALAILYLIAILIVNGFTEIIIRDIGLIGGFLSLLFWNNFRNRY